LPAVHTSTTCSTRHTIAHHLNIARKGQTLICALNRQEGLRAKGTGHRAKGAGHRVQDAAGCKDEAMSGERRA